MAMAPQPQPNPNQQIVYQNDLALAMDRSYEKFASYSDARFDRLEAQIRINEQESIARDRELAQRMSSVEATQKTIIDMQRSSIETMQTLQATMQAIQQEMREGFAAQAERHNELMVRVERLERGVTPPETDA